MRRVFIDSSVLILASGGPHPRKEACLKVVGAVARQQAQCHVSTEAVQELVVHRMRKDDEHAVRIARQVAAMCVLHPFDEQVLERSLSLIEDSGVRGHDAVHAATALLAGFTEIVSADDDFAGVLGLRRIDPADWEPAPA